MAEGGGVTVRDLLQTFPHHNPDGSFSVIVDLTVIEVSGPNRGVVHRLWNIVTTGRNGIGSAPLGDFFLPAGVGDSFDAMSTLVASASVTVRSAPPWFP